MKPVISIKPKSAIHGNDFVTVKLHNKRITVAELKDSSYMVCVINYNKDREGAACGYRNPRKNVHIDEQHTSRETLEAIYLCIQEILFNSK